MKYPGPASSRKLTVCSSGDESDYSDVSDEEDLKLVLVVRQDLKMGKGKAAAQCCHATLAAYKRAKRKCPDRLKVWEATGQPKITVKCDSEEELMLLMVKARSLDLVSYVVADAGRTQIAPGSHTVLAVGPAPGHLVDQVSSQSALSQLSVSVTICISGHRKSQTLLELVHLSSYQNMLWFWCCERDLVIGAETKWDEILAVIFVFSEKWI